MAIVLRHRGPRMIQRGSTVTLDADVRDEEGTAQTVTTSGSSLTITDGSEVVVDAAAITGGTGATYSLLDSVTTSRPLSDRWLERWSLVVSGRLYVLTRPAYLVRSVFTPVLVPADLQAEYSDINEIQDPDVATWGAKVTDARETIERDLIKKGRRPDLIFDSWALFDAHRHLTLHLIFKDAKASIGDGRYAELADHHLTEYRREMESIHFRYDTAEAGNITDTTTSSVTPPMFITAGRSRRQGGLGRRAWR